MTSKSLSCAGGRLTSQAGHLLVDNKGDDRHLLYMELIGQGDIRNGTVLASVNGERLERIEREEKIGPDSIAVLVLSLGLIYEVVRVVAPIIKQF